MMRMKQQLLSQLLLRVRVLGLVLVGLTCVGALEAAHAQTTDDNETSTQPDTSAEQSVPASSQSGSPTRPLEQITVTGEKTIMAIRFQLRQAEDAMYDQFNELNSTDDFDINCSSVRGAGSHIAERICEPRFLARERHSNNIQVLTQMRDGGPSGAGGLSGPGVNGNADASTGTDFAAIDNYQQEDGELKFLLTDKYELMAEEMVKLASENPDFLRALQRVETFRQALVKAREERFGN